MNSQKESPRPKPYPIQEKNSEIMKEIPDEVLEKQDRLKRIKEAAERLNIHLSAVEIQNSIRFMNACVKADGTITPNSEKGIIEKYQSNPTLIRY